ncbi:hypothetical protein COCVIDRAFT_12879 [Bipolaris victoriae FI3]|uniref:Uncharacterized protein n=1 Tax=Bipolaris victoriae (strain FI3) TaxID=930091 RepID=W7F3G4_BIPV3|nr:hypothetical protein COCVIDRAFT_12879 [Bipolaris victoriae FI3]
MNTTTTALKQIVSLPFSLLAALPRPTFSYVPTAHIKLKADSIAMVVLVLARHVWMYVQGWRDSGLRRRKGGKGGGVGNGKGKKGRGRGKARGKGKDVRGGRRAGTVVKGRYTLVLRHKNDSNRG